MKYIGIVYVPDYVANAGSLIATLSKNKTATEIEKEIDMIYDLTKYILRTSRREGKTTTEVSNDMALRRLVSEDA
jgi:glutamate dehydrogenase/leucine dehydrogenase